MNWEKIEGWVLLVACVAALGATTWLIWFCYELIWAFRCAFRF